MDTDTYVHTYDNYTLSPAVKEGMYVCYFKQCLCSIIVTYYDENYS